MKISKQARREAKALFRGCLVNGALDEGRARVAVQKVLEFKPRGYLAMLSHFARLARLNLERRATRVEAATPLDPALQENLKTALARRYGPGLQISFAQNPALIGGLRVQVGSDVFDGSVQARLKALRDSF